MVFLLSIIDFLHLSISSSSKPSISPFEFVDRSDSLPLELDFLHAAIFIPSCRYRLFLNLVVFRESTCLCELSCMSSCVFFVGQVLLSSDQVAAHFLLSLDGLEEGLEVTGTKALEVVALDDLDEDGRAVQQMLSQKVSLPSNPQ